MQRFGSSSRDWDELASMDPLWAVLTLNDKRGNRWDIEEFWETGRDQVDATMGLLERLGWNGARELAVDFGCGVGRMSRALSPYFDRTVGVDISNKMVELARDLNAGVSGLEFERIDGATIDAIQSGTVDMVHTILVLQHLPNATQAIGYLHEFERILRPGGVLVFDIITETRWTYRLRARRRLYRILRVAGVAPERLHAKGLTSMTMTSVPVQDVDDFIRESGLEVLLIDDQQKGSFSKRFYYLRKPG
ncbi:MAG: class I SAM-dependent methyltransferase [Acidimicrobiales bacterium]|nr:class I SAM-dependent methyltransferase [Acidimicrobiales bacterium]RZV48456.1 MAG: class I SAM-dependent methyltransferase [Acidimicrobiales bacterium]